MNTKTLNQNSLYHGLIAQLKSQYEIKVQVEIKEIVLQPRKIKTDSFRYLLKICDVVLRTENEVTPQNQNKISFTTATKEDLIHHISWLKELCWSNNLVPFDDAHLYKDMN